MQGVLGSIPKQGDYRNEELRADDIHFLIAIGDVHDARVVQVAVRLQQGDHDGILTVLSPPVLAARPRIVALLKVGIGEGRGP